MSANPLKIFAELCVCAMNLGSRSRTGGGDLLAFIFIRFSKEVYGLKRIKHTATEILEDKISP